MRQLLGEIGMAFAVVMATALLGAFGRMVDALWDTIDYLIRRIRYRNQNRD